MQYRLLDSIMKKWFRHLPKKWFSAMSNRWPAIQHAGIFKCLRNISSEMFLVINSALCVTQHKQLDFSILDAKVLLGSFIILFRHSQWLISRWIFLYNYSNSFRVSESSCTYHWKVEKWEKINYVIWYVKYSSSRVYPCCSFYDDKGLGHWPNIKKSVFLNCFRILFIYYNTKLRFFTTLIQWLQMKWRTKKMVLIDFGNNRFTQDNR